MKFTFATIHVKDLETSIGFYEEVLGMKDHLYKKCDC